MTVYGIAGEISLWAEDELRAQSVISHEEFGFAVTMIPVPQPGGATAIFWCLLVTLRHPLLGHDALGSTGKIQANEPSEAAVREIARSSAEALRTAFANAKKDIMAKGNGHSELPPGLIGRKL